MHEMDENEKKIFAAKMRNEGETKMGDEMLMEEMVAMHEVLEECFPKMFSFVRHEVKTVIGDAMLDDDTEECISNVENKTNKLQEELDELKRKVDALDTNQDDQNCERETFEDLATKRFSEMEERIRLLEEGSNGNSAGLGIGLVTAVAVGRLTELLRHQLEISEREVLWNKQRIADLEKCMPDEAVSNAKNVLGELLDMMGINPEENSDA